MNSLFLNLHRRSRQKKHEMFLNLLEPRAEMSVLNVGVTGTHEGLSAQFESFWEHHDRVTGGSLSLVDVRDYQRSFPRTHSLVFDGCALPFADQSFDIVYSNAVLEHLPGWEAQQQFAHEVMRVGRGWFITTPNLWFPVEPHYHLPLVQFLPQAAQRALVKSLGRVPYDSLHLLSSRQMRALFPRGEVTGCRVTFHAETLVAHHSPQNARVS